MTGKGLNPHGLVDPTLLHHDGEWCERCQRSCDHDSSTGVDDAPFGPDKVWRCDICGWLHRCVQVEGEPEGSVVLRGLVSEVTGGE